MNLSERLAAAQAERGEVLEPEHPMIPGILRAVPPASGDFSPTSCPSCGTRGRADIIDTIRDLAEMSCPSCSTLWRIEHLREVEPSLIWFDRPEVVPSNDAQTLHAVDS